MADQIPILTHVDESEGLDSTTKYKILTGIDENFEKLFTIAENQFDDPD